MYTCVRRNINYVYISLLETADDFQLKRNELTHLNYSFLGDAAVGSLD